MNKTEEMLTIFIGYLIVAGVDVSIIKQNITSCICDMQVLHKQGDADDIINSLMALESDLADAKLMIDTSISGRIQADMN